MLMWESWTVVALLLPVKPTVLRHRMATITLHGSLRVRVDRSWHVGGRLIALACVTVGCCSAGVLTRIHLGALLAATVT